MPAATSRPEGRPATKRVETVRNNSLGRFEANEHNWQMDGKVLVQNDWVSNQFLKTVIFTITMWVRFCDWWCSCVVIKFVKVEWVSSFTEEVQSIWKLRLLIMKAKYTYRLFLLLLRSLLQNVQEGSLILSYINRSLSHYQLRKLLHRIQLVLECCGNTWRFFSFGLSCQWVVTRTFCQCFSKCQMGG